MDLLDRLLRHDTWTTRQLLLIAGELTDEQLDREFDMGHRSLRATFLHLIANMEVWSELMAGTAVDLQNDPRRLQRSVTEMLSRLQRASTTLEQVARRVAESNRWDELWIDPLDGRSKSYGGAIAHIITHSMHHRAQILYLLRQVGVVDLPEGDVLSWEAAFNRGREAD